MTKHWFRGTRFGVRNLLRLNNSIDAEGLIDVDALYPGLVPPEANTLILTVERGFDAIPLSGSECVSLRVMPQGYNTVDMLDRAKTQEWIKDGKAIDVVAQHVPMPIDMGSRKFFWALQSTCPSEAVKMAIIDLWGYET